MTIVPMGQAIYVVANFKETQIERMFRGEKVDLSIDTFPGVKFAGTVDSLSPGSGAQFALLPPENATGNFTKIVQRVPVKILIDNPPQDRLGQLRPGLSVEADVDTRTAPPPGQRQTLVMPAASSASPSEAVMAAHDRARRGNELSQLGRGVRRHPWRLHGGARHPDHQCVA